MVSNPSREKDPLLEMGKDGTGLPLSLKVKNTFIDINSGFQDEGDGEDPNFLQQDNSRSRQFSEPAMPFARNVSTGSPLRDGRTNLEGTLPEETDSEELDETQEPEQEIDPSWRLMGRQETDRSWGGAAASKWGRMETEQSWPSWGMQVGQPPLDMNGIDPNSDLVIPQGLAANGMWLYQMPGMDASGSLSWPMNGMTPPQPAMNNQGRGTGPATQSPAAAVPPPAAGDIPASWANTNTVMMRNLPNKYTQHMLLEELNQSGFLGTFDFMYLPIDPDTNANRGYSFINFTDPSFAWMLKMTYEGRKMNSFNSDKVVSVAPAALQGFEANYAHYSTSRVNRGDPAARPLFLRESTMKGASKPTGRRRGGRRSSGSLIDLATRGQPQPPPGTQVPGVQPKQPTQAPQQSPAAPAAGGEVVKDEAKMKQGGPVEGGPRFCPFCGGKCKTHFRFCQFCGASLNLVGAPA